MALNMNPMDILAVINLLTELIQRATSYLSTLPHPIEPLEELISVTAVTSTLLNSLQTALDRFPDLEFSLELSFLNPLSQDIIYAITQLNGRVEEAKRSKIFQPNDVGLVRLPRNAWVLIMGTEAKAASLRSRLYVEKYRVRVLIDAVTWYGLRSLEIRSVDEEREYQMLRNRLGLIAERLAGVWRDYTPRLKQLENANRGQNMNGQPSMNPFMDPVEVERQRNLQRQLQQQMMNQVQAQAQAQAQLQAMNQPPRYEVSMEEQQMAPQQSVESRTATPVSRDEKQALGRVNSCDSCSSDIKYETYLLRRNLPTTHIKTSTRTAIFGLPIIWSKTQTHTPATHYVKPLPSSSTEITAYQTHSSARFSDASQHMLHIRKTILGMPDDAQWEIQKLVESKELATSKPNVRREWEVVGFVERPRRRINYGAVAKKRWFWQRSRGNKSKVSKKDQVEWVLVLRGETKDREERIMPGKNCNPWEGENKDKRDEEQMRARERQVFELQARQQLQAQQQQAAAAAAVAQMQGPASVLRHVEQRRTMSVDEAERKMDEMLKDMFKFEDNDDEDEDEEEDEIPDEKMESDSTS